MCGVGKWMQRGGKWDVDKFPLCGAPEDASHVYVCTSSGSSMIWDSSLSVLQAWLDNQNTDTAIILALLQGLREWRGHHDHRPLLQPAQLSVDQQTDIGWSLLLEGWLATAQAQQEYYSIIRSKKSGRKWAHQLIGKLLEIAKALWTH